MIVSAAAIVPMLAKKAAVTSLTTAVSVLASNQAANAANVVLSTTKASPILSSSFLSMTSQSLRTGMFPIILTSAVYMMVANYIYVARRAHLRRTTKWYIWNVRTTREEGISRPLFVVILLAWQAMVVVFPFLEPAVSLFGYVCFMYSYPNAQGFGYILEPLRVQREKVSVRNRNQIRLDWHRFTVNVGNIGRDGYRHPPTVTRNLPHVDVPARGMKHWPWRRRHGSTPVD